MADRFVTIARIVKTRGVRGEVAAVLLTDFPARFAHITDVRVLREGLEFFEKLQKHWFHKGRVILKFEGLDRPHEVQHLVGGEVQVPERQRVEPPKDVYFHSDLIGCRVFEAGRRVGRVRDVFEAGEAAANLAVEAPDGSESLIPLVRRFVVRIDVAGKKIEVKLPPGLLEASRVAARKQGPKKDSQDRGSDED